MRRSACAGKLWDWEEDARLHRSWPRPAHTGAGRASPATRAGRAQPPLPPPRRAQLPPPCSAPPLRVRARTSLNRFGEGTRRREEGHFSLFYQPYDFFYFLKSEIQMKAMGVISQEQPTPSFWNRRGKITELKNRGKIIIKLRCRDKNTIPLFIIPEVKSLCWNRRGKITELKNKGKIIIKLRCRDKNANTPFYYTRSEKFVLCCTLDMLLHCLQFTSCSGKAHAAYLEGRNQTRMSKEANCVFMFAIDQKTCLLSPGVKTIIETCPSRTCSRIP
jgi:hypothetical protein